jgi:hypothetical protein
LDGGEYIFDNRSRKYNIQRILREAQNGWNIELHISSWWG